MSGTDQYSLKTFQGAAGLERLKPHWKKLTRTMAAAGFYHRAEWYEAYLEWLEDDPDSFHFYSVFDESGRLVAVFPLKR